MPVVPWTGPPPFGGKAIVFFPAKRSKTVKPDPTSPAEQPDTSEDEPRRD